MVWTSLISKITLSLLVLGTLCTCSSSKIRKSQINKTPSRVRAKINSGPQSKAIEETFKDVTKSIGLAGLSATHLYAVDWDADGYDDLVALPEFYGTPHFFKFDPKKNKFEKLSDNPFKKLVRASFLVFADFNKDSILDVIVGTLNQKTELTKYPLRLFLAQKNNDSQVSYIEKKDAFTDLKLSTSSVSLIDVNLDGLLDVYVGNWFDYSSPKLRSSRDRMLLAVGKGLKWKDASYLLEGEFKYDSELEIYPNARASFGTSVCDLDQNGYADILSTSSSGQKNKVWLNFYDRKNKDRILKDKASEMGLDSDEEGSFGALGGGNSFYMLCHDYNNDGIMDVARGELFHSYDSETRDRSAIMTGSSVSYPPQFIKTEYHKDDGSGSWSQGDRRAVWADFNFDSQTDLLIDNSGFPPKSRLVLFEQDKFHGYQDKAKEYGLDIVNPSGSVTTDFNQDGRLDLIVGQIGLRDSRIKSKVYAFRNEFPFENKKILKLELVGKKANAHGIGATVIMSTNFGRYMKVVDYSYGALPSQNMMALTFGLSADEVIKKIEVRWPILEKGRANQHYPMRQEYSQIKFKGAQFLSLKLFEDGSVKRSAL